MINVSLLSGGPRLSPPGAGESQHGDSARHGCALGVSSGQQGAGNGLGEGRSGGGGPLGGLRDPGQQAGESSSLKLMLNDPFWAKRVKNLGKGRRYTADYEYDGKSFKTRADTGGKKSLLGYANKDSRPVKRDWICVCEASNFERNYECRNCRRPKEEGMREEIDVDILQQRQDRNNQIKSKNNKESGPPSKENLTPN